jgi:hypothetical protein
MSADVALVAAVGVGAIVVGLFAYAAYWGLRVRAVLMGRLYRNRALWVASVAILFAFLISANFVIYLLGSTDWYLSLLQFLVEYATAILTFAWIDTTIGVARTSDPLQRDTLRWRTLRIFLWAFVIISVVGGLGSVIVERTNFFSSPGGPEGVLLYGPFGNLIGLIALFLSRRRSKDLILRRHMMWLSLFVVILSLSTQSELSRLPDARLFATLVLVLGASFLYLAARSLVPVSVKLGALGSEDHRLPYVAEGGGGGGSPAEPKYSRDLSNQASSASKSLTIHLPLLQAMRYSSLASYYGAMSMPRKFQRSV